MESIYVSHPAIESKDLNLLYKDEFCAFFYEIW